VGDRCRASSARFGLNRHCPKRRAHDGDGGLTDAGPSQWRPDLDDERRFTAGVRSQELVSPGLAVQVEQGGDGAVNAPLVLAGVNGRGSSSHTR
jgi:hypothetical protein